MKHRQGAGKRLEMEAERERGESERAAAKSFQQANIDFLSALNCNCTGLDILPSHKM